MVSNTEIRKITKRKALSMLSVRRQMNMKEIAAYLTQWNGWRVETNIRIVREMEIIGAVVIDGDTVQYVESAK